MDESVYMVLVVVGGILSLILTIVWMLVPFTLGRIERALLRSEEIHEETIRLLKAQSKCLTTISQQLDYLVQAKAREIAGHT